MTARISRWFALVLLLAAASCGADNGLTDLGITPLNGTMTATVDGSAWSAIQIAVVRNGGLISVGGSDSALLAIGFAIQDLGTDTYLVGGVPLATANVGQNSDTWTAAGPVGSGSVVVTALSATGVSGTFSFTAELSQGVGGPAERVVTNGTFNVTF